MSDITLRVQTDDSLDPDRVPGEWFSPPRLHIESQRMRSMSPEDREKAETRIARALCRRIKYLIAAFLADKDMGLRGGAATAMLRDHDREFFENALARDALAAALRHSLASLPRPPFDPGERYLPGALEPLFEEGILAWDARLVRHLQSYGSVGKAQAEKTAKAAQERLARFESGEDVVLWELWSGTLLGDAVHDLQTEFPHAIQGLLWVLWFDEVKPRIESPPARIEIVHDASGNQYTTLPKVTAATSWGMGAPGMIDIHGQKYVAEPQFGRRLVPRTWSLLPEDHSRRPHQASFPMALDGGEPETLPVAVANSQGVVMSTGAAKYSLLFLAMDAHARGGLSASTLGDLTAFTRPSASRLQQRDYVSAAEEIAEAKALHVFLPDETKVQIFDVQTPWTPRHARPEMQIWHGLTRTFQQTIREGMRGRLLRGNEYSGAFLVNISGVMALPNKNPLLLRLYIRQAAAWNAAFKFPSGRFDKGELPFQSRDEIARITNAMPRGAVEYLLAKGEERTKLASTRRALVSRGRKDVLDGLEALADEYKLGKLEKQGADGFRLLPTKEHEAAWAEMRSNGGRPFTIPSRGATPPEVTDAPCTNPVNILHEPRKIRARTPYTKTDVTG